jgi:hypothetical protein
VAAPGSDRAGQALRLLPPGARLARERAELLLGEKRLVLSLLRTGLAAVVLPLALAAALAATSGPDHVLRALAIPVVIACAALLAVGTVLLLRALRALDVLERRLGALRRRGGPLGEPTA